jgi:hypothetical protein
MSCQNSNFRSHVLEMSPVCLVVTNYNFHNDKYTKQQQTFQHFPTANLTSLHHNDSEQIYKIPKICKIQLIITNYFIQ